MFLISFVITLYSFIIFIPFLRKRKLGQIVRVEGPKAHYGKNGTPTFGGVIFVISTTILFIYYSIIYRFNLSMMILLVIPLILYGSIGFLDDGLVVRKNTNKGLKPLYKIIFEIIWAGIYFFLYLDYGYNTTVRILSFEIDIYFLYGALILLMFVSSANAVNLTDGVDGLASGLMIIVLIITLFLSFYRNSIEIFTFSLILLASLLAYLCYNFKPAKIFMGDSGSLALGATLANIFILLKMEFLIFFVGIVFIIETISDIIQIIYFKATKGKRFFLMAPLHHHFELKGVKEVQIDFLFWFIGLIGGIIALFLAYNFY